MGYFKELDIERQTVYVIQDLDLEEIVMVCESRADAEEMALALAEEYSYQAYIYSNYDNMEEDPADPRDFTLPWVGLYVIALPFVRSDWSA